MAARSSGFELNQSEPRQRGDQDSDQANIFETDDDPNRITTWAPPERFRLGYVDVTCLVINRTIGSGIFQNPQRVMQVTQSTGVSLLFWLFGVVYCLAGTHVYLEYGLNIPRYFIEGVEQSVPRSGGDLNYLQYVFRRPRYHKNTVLFSGTVFGIVFITFGNMASNCLQFAIRVLEASNVQNPSEGAIRAIAIAVAVFACFIHAFSRRGGILLNNALAFVKIGILLLIIVTTIVVAAGGFPKTENVISKNTSPKTAFEGSSNEAYGYAQAFLAIIFAFSGFEQPNYVLGEIGRPRRKYPIALCLGVGIICVSYMIVNVCYMVVVPKEEQMTNSVAQRFFELTFGQISGDSNIGNRVFQAMLATSAFGNIVVMTYTAARVKQEIAKEGALPWPKFFASNSDFSLGRLLRFLRRKGWFSSLINHRWLLPEEHSEKTPVGALLLHLVFCLILILSTYGMGSANAYGLLTNLASYSVNAASGVFLGLGILILRFRGPPQTPPPSDGPPAASADDSSSGDAPRRTWRQMATHTNPAVSVVAAAVYMVGNLFPIVASLVPPSARYVELARPSRAWYLVPVIGWAVIGAGALWWLGFVTFARRIERKQHQVFTVEKVPEFEAEDEGSGVEGAGRGGGYVQLHETVYLAWVGAETLRKGKKDSTTPEHVEVADVRTTGQPLFPQDHFPFERAGGQMR